ncbi:hypothetical protein GCM10027066_00030 [Dyella jejuensis]
MGNNVTIDAAVGTSDINQGRKVSQDGINVGIGGAAANVAHTVYYAAQRSTAGVWRNAAGSLDARRYLVHETIPDLYRRRHRLVSQLQ